MHPERSGEEMDRASSEMLRRLRNPEVSLTYYSQEKLLEIEIDSPETRFFDEWKRLEPASRHERNKFPRTGQSRY